MPEHPLVAQAYRNLGPWARADQNGHLLALLKAVLDPLLEIDDVAREGSTFGVETLTLGGITLGFGSDTLGIGYPGKPYLGWGSLLDVDAAPEWALPWLAQFVGVQTIQDLDGVTQRLRIKGVAGFHRGTPASIIEAARQYLTGTRNVELYEREGSPWVFRLRTYVTETPDPAKVQAAVEAIKPAGVVFIYELQEGIEVDDLTGTVDGLAGTIDSYISTTPV